MKLASAAANTSSFRAIKTPGMLEKITKTPFVMLKTWGTLALVSLLVAIQLSCAASGKNNSRVQTQAHRSSADSTAATDSSLSNFIYDMNTNDVVSGMAHAADSTAAPFSFEVVEGQGKFMKDLAYNGEVILRITDEGILHIPSGEFIDVVGAHGGKITGAEVRCAQIEIQSGDRMKECIIADFQLTLDNGETVIVLVIIDPADHDKAGSPKPKGSI